jgi:hypothetical protein
MMRPNLPFLLFVVAALCGLARPTTAEPLQRMVVAPGCYDLAPGKSADVSAYCLDEGRRAPPHGALLTQAPPTLGDAVVRRGAEALALAAAIADGWLLVEGLGEFSQLRLRNVSGVPVTVCFRQPTVVMAGDGAAGRLETGYERIKALIAGAAATTDSERRSLTQRALWDLVDRVEERDAATPGREATEARRPAPPVRRCSGDAGSTVACLER